MRKSANSLLIAAAAAALVIVLGAGTPAVAQNPAVVAEGKEIAFNRTKGNCLACHVMDDGSLPGNIGPPLIAMQARFPDKAALRAQIYDARGRNPETIMPPFGPHAILTESEIDKVTEFVWSL